MAKYRQIHVSFWQDTFVLDLTPEEKYFYLYLMTNSKTSACGIYELPKRVMELETGYNRETIDKLLKRFIEYGKVEYCEATKEVYLCNWIRFNEPKSDLTAKCVVGELNAVKFRPFAESYHADAALIGYPLQGATKPIPSKGEGEGDRNREGNGEGEIEPPPGLDLNAWKQWEEYRRQIRKPLKPVSIPAAQQSLAAFGSDQVAVVTQSIANGWQGLFALKIGGKHETHQPVDNSAPARVRRAYEQREREARTFDAERVD